MPDVILAALVSLFDPRHFLFLGLGVVLGMVVGILPGLGGTAMLSLLLPFVFGKDPAPVLAMMVGLLAVNNTSDTFPAVLMGIPGSSSSQATILDGFPLARRGEAARALGAAFSASMLGGLFGAFVLTLAIHFARPIILGVGFGEQLMLIILALSMVGMLTGASALKGLATCGVGLLLGSVGAAPATGEHRLAFDTIYLGDGINVVIVGLAMFAIPEIVDILRRHVRISSTQKLGSGTLRGFAETLRHLWLVVRCSSIGTALGALPGMGGPVITWVAYGHVVQTVRNRENLGKGDIRGVIGPESANNADNGGAMIPALMFGIPASGSMAIFLGGLILIGIEPGIGMLERHLDLTFTIIWSLALANVIGTGLCLALAKPISRITLVPFAMVAPFMIAIVYFAAYQVTRSWLDLVALFVLGVLGVYMKRFGWSPPALLIGFVVAKRLDASVYQSVQVYGMSFLERTGVQIMLALIVVSIILAMRFKRARTPLTPEGPHGAAGRTPQMIFLGLILACVVYAIYEMTQLTFLARVFPLSVALITLVLLLAAAALSLRGKPSYVLTDAEREWSAEERPAHSVWHYLGWMLGLLAASAVFGFVLGIFVYITVFLRVKAHVAWHKAALSASGAVIVLSVLSYILVLDYPGGLLQYLVAMPWPLD
ncbi:MAG TPA: tripartite tricarboxylate transporter permease [Burkholderiales bacterium]|nr:tripartite tricarboxylate transporter permease [Burkholderiales bacterium]